MKGIEQAKRGEIPKTLERKRLMSALGVQLDERLQEGEAELQLYERAQRRIEEINIKARKFELAKQKLEEAEPTRQARSNGRLENNRKQGQIEEFRMEEQTVEYEVWVVKGRTWRIPKLKHKYNPPAR